jgi:essential nuclear protein 1
MVGKKPAKRGRQGLAEDMHAHNFVVPEEVPVRRGGPRTPRDDDDDNANFSLAAGASKRILKASRAQLNDGDADDDAPAPLEDDEEGEEGEEAEEGEDEDAEAESEADIEYDDAESHATEMMEGEYNDLAEDYDFDEEEARLMDKFQPGTAVQSRNLADIIMSKIREKQDGAREEDEQSQTSTEFASGSKIDSRVRKVYLAIGGILKRYTSGKIPKAFKVLPHVQNWEQLLMLTKPAEWSAHATYAATRIFAAHLNEKMAQRYYNAVLLPIVQHTNNAKEGERRIHPALFMALRKALFKPIAFYKGFLLPMTANPDCNLRCALAVGSLLQKMHLPPVPTAVALVRISEQEYSSANTLILRVIIDKKMALPYQAIDALVKHFHKFCVSHPRSDELPVLWHQTLLCFVQHYKTDLTEDQLELVKQVCAKHFHHLITPEVRREIAAMTGKSGL